MSENVTETRARFAFMRNVKEQAKSKFVRIGAAVAIVGTTLIGTASAAVNFTPIQELLTAVISLIPSFMDLVIEVAPIVVLISVVGFIVKFWDRILAMFNF